MRSLKKRGPHVLDDLMTSYFPYKCTRMRHQGPDRTRRRRHQALLSSDGFVGDKGMHHASPAHIGLYVQQA